MVCVVRSKMEVVSEELGVLGIITPLPISSHGVMKADRVLTTNVHVCSNDVYVCFNSHIRMQGSVLW